MPWWIFGWAFFWVVLALGWSYLCFKAGWHAHTDQSIREFMARHNWPRDDPPGGVHV